MRLMARSIPIALVALSSLIAAPSAIAQLQIPNIFDTIFRQEPPRPPANVPNRPPAQSQPLPPGGLPPGPPPRRIQSEPLPPPPGAGQAPQRPQDARAPVQENPAQAPNQLPGLPPGQRQPRGAPQTASISPQPDEGVVEPPASKIPNPTAVFSGLDKITGRIISFEVAIGETVRFGALEVTPRVCYTRAPTETPNTDGFIEVDELTLQGELKRIFTGWMFVTSPGLNAVEHPIYDVWLTDCKGATQPVVAETPPPAPAPPPSRTQRQREQRAPARSQLPPTLPPPPLR